MNSAPNICVRPRGRYVNVDADDVEIGYLTLTTDGDVDGAWAYGFGNRWIIDVVRACYAAARAA